MQGWAMKPNYWILIAVFGVSMVGGLIWSANHYNAKYQSEKLRADAAEREADAQAQIVAQQATDFNRFNQIAWNTGQLNAALAAGSEKTVIEYREILRREKTCDLPVPADVAGGLLEHAHRLRASALHADSAGTDSADGSPTATGKLTYCQAVLWIEPLLVEIEKGNNRFAGIREIETGRK